MKRKDIQDLRSKTISQLKKLSADYIEELGRLKLELKAEKLKNIKEYFLKRRDLARIKTLIREKELNEAA